MTHGHEDTEKPKKKSQKGKAIGGILGMLPSIAGAIPGLLKSKQTGALRDMQQGRGAGATAARQAGSEAGRRTAGNAGGRGSSGQVRAGLRSAEEMTSRGAQAAGLIGAQEGIVGTRLLLDEERRRRGAGLQLGAAVGGAAAAGLATSLAGADQGPAGQEVSAALTQPASTVVDPNTGLASPQGQEAVLGPGRQALGQLGTTSGQFDATTGEVGDQQRFMQGAQAGLEGIRETREGLAQDNVEAGFAMQAIVSPDQMFDEGKAKYIATTTSPSERPAKIEPSPGGTEFSARQSAIMSSFENDVMAALDRGEINPEEAAQMIQELKVEMQGGF